MCHKPAKYCYKDHCIPLGISSPAYQHILHTFHCLFHLYSYQSFCRNLFHLPLTVAVISNFMIFITESGE